MPINLAFSPEQVAPQQFGFDANAVRIKKIPLDVARQGEQLDITGTVLWAVGASDKTAQVDISFQEQHQDGIPFTQGQFLSGLRFSQVFLTNTAQAGKFITILYARESARGLLIQNPSSPISQVSIIKGAQYGSVNDIALAAGVQANVMPALAGTRDVLITSPVTNTNIIRVGGALTGAANGTPIQPGETLTLTTTANIYAYSVTAQTLALSFTTD